jgi:hypothetical protein
MAAETTMGSPVAGYPRLKPMSETELSVICKNCGSEVSPYVTECPYCGARLRKRAPKLERRGDALEAQRPKRRRRRLKLRRPSRPSAPTFAVSEQRPYATLAIILGSAILLLVQKATGDSLSTFGGLIVPFGDEWWRYLTAPFAYVDVGYLFVVAGGIASAKGDITVIAGGNGMALGAIAAWFAIRRAESHGTIDEEYDLIGVAVAAIVVIALPLFAPTADFFSCLVGGAVGGLAGLAATTLHHKE